ESGIVRRFDTLDGLPKGTIEDAYRDQQGQLWFGSAFGLARYTPPAAPARSSPVVYVTALRVAGMPQPLSPLGETAPSPVALAPDQNSLSVEYLAIGGDLGAPFRYQYRLDTRAPWSAATDQRMVNFAHLAPGSYALDVRAIDGDGRIVPQSAHLAFTIASPIWMRWWCRPQRSRVWS